MKRLALSLTAAFLSLAAAGTAQVRTAGAEVATGHARFELEME